MPANYPVEPPMIPARRGTYEYNPACSCVCCVNKGNLPFRHAGETLGYANPHLPLTPMVKLS